jgi:hypothetical protein
MQSDLRPHRDRTVLALGMPRTKTGFVLLLLLSLLSSSCYVNQPWPWRDEPKPWDAKAVDKTYRVRVHDTNGQEITLFRAAIIQENGREVLVGRVWNPREDTESTARLDLLQVERLETQRMRLVLVGASASHVMGLCCTVLAIVLIVSLF